MKVYYIAGFLFAGIFGAFSVAHAGEAQTVSSSAYGYVQPVTYAQNIQPVPQTRRVIRVEQPTQPRAVMVNGAYVMSDMAQTQTVTRRVQRFAAQPKLKATPNLYSTTSQSHMPVMFSRDAMTAR